MSWGRRRNSRSYYEGSRWAPYVPVAERRASAAREMDKLRRKGEDIQPIEIEGRTIARSFWGKGWCTHLESFGDYSNRLPRGRTYVRNGSVCHLAIGRGNVDAMVSGSALYRVRVDVVPLAKRKWNHLKQRCTGRIGSLIELLQGRLSDEIMRTVTDRENGLFPLPGEITYTCSCPDWARMCKHVSAVMYGIGARLDARPELLFHLRGVDHAELIAAEAAADTLAKKGSRASRRRTLADTDLESMFGVELDESPAPPTRKAPARKVAARKPRPFKPTSRSIAALRRKLGMSRTEFARAVGVSPATIAMWEKANGPVKPHSKGLAGLQRLHAAK